MWFSVPPETIRNPSFDERAPKAARWSTTCSEYVGETRPAASLNATALAAMTCSSGPPC